MRQAIPFGKYLLLDRISVGGMAEVFKAKSYGVEGFEKVIAIKRILPSMGEDREFIKMFIDEAKIVGQLAHANICQIFELGRTDGAHFIAMEYIWGKDLLQIQNRARKLKQQIPVTMACFIVAKVLEGLDYAHKKRDALGRPLEIVHRDCSPQNVLISYEGEVKIIDFGIAKAASRSSKTQAGVLKGKFGYMSPEQVRGLPLDRRSDIFAAGTILYECLSGDRLFVGETDFSTLEKVRNVDIPRPREVNPAIPEAVERIIMKALAKDAADRYQWGSEMVGDLQRFLMSQDTVFTAKTLSSWLKEGFAAEVDRERQQHESFKKLGREGLIAGVPQAEAKLDVVEHLGEAGKADDPTVLGGPNFEDLVDEHGRPLIPSAAPAAGAPAEAAARGDNEEFAEEGPTEIFGELSESAAVPEAPVPPAGVVVAPNARRPPTVQGGRGMPAPPPGAPRAGTPPPVAAQPPPSRAEDPTISPLGSPLVPIPMAAQAPMPAPSSSANARTMLGMQAPTIPQGAGMSPASLPLSSPPTGQSAAAGFPSPDQLAAGSQPPAPPYAANGPGGYPQAQPGGYGYLGPSAPGGGGYGGGGGGGGYGAPGGDGSGMGGPGGYGAGGYGAPGAGGPGMGGPGGPGMGGMGPGGPGMNGGMGGPGGPGMGPGGMGPGPDGGMGYGGPGMGGSGYPSGGQYPPNQGYPVDPSQTGYPGQSGFGADGYPVAGGGFGAYGSPAAAQQPAAPEPKRRKKPSLAKDVLIGVGIAAIVLGAFAIVKFVVMADKPAAKPTPVAAVGSIDVAIADGGAAEVYIDGVKRGDAAGGKLSIGALPPGPHQVRIARLGAVACESQIEIVAGEARAVPCELKPEPAAVAIDAGTDVDAGVPGDAGVEDTATAPIDAAIDAELVAIAPPPGDDDDDDDVKPGSGSARRPGSGSARTGSGSAKPRDDGGGGSSTRIDLGGGSAKPTGSGSGSAKPGTGSGSVKPTGTGTGTGSAKPTGTGTGTGSAKPTGTGTTGTGTGSGSAKPPAGGEGYLIAYTTPFAAVWIDGVSTGKTTPITPRAKIPLSPGLHKVQFKVGKETFGYTVKIEAGKTTTISRDLKVTQP